MLAKSTLRLFVLLLFVSCGGGEKGAPDDLSLLPAVADNMEVKGALLTKRFASFEAFREEIQVEYVRVNQGSLFGVRRVSEVRMTHANSGQQVSSILKSGIAESEFSRAKNGGFLDKVWLGLNSPYAAISRNDLLSVFILARRRQNMFGWGDVAFYDLSEQIYCHISADESAALSSEDLSEKGYFNTFNHIMGQAFMTSIFSERLADFIADVHERQTLPELITGVFSEAQLKDIDDGPVDNYVDLINNEWGQELGKLLKKKYDISRETYWTPALLANYLNDIQNYFSWAFQISFLPFSTSDEVIIRFSSKMNSVLENVRG